MPSTERYHNLPDWVHETEHARCMWENIDTMQKLVFPLMRGSAGGLNE